jgi:mycothiol system anti-sigma-R factor
MSCTSGFDDGECGAVLRDVWLFLDDELDPERRAAVQRHLDDCSPCLEEAGLDAKLKQLLQRKCGGDHAPEHLRQRVVASLTQVRVTDGDGLSVDTVTTTSVTVEWGDTADDQRDGSPGSAPRS